MADLKRLESALIAADKAGNKEDAAALAKEIRRLRGASSAPASPSRSAPARSFRGDYGPSEMSYGKPSGQAIDLALEAGLPMAAQALTSPGAGVGVTSAVGAGASALGNILAQTRRMITGEQEEFSGSQLTERTVLGAVPFVGPAKTASKLISAGRTAANIGIAGASGVVGKAIQTGMDEQRLPTLSEAKEAGAIPAAFVAGLGPIGLLGKRLTRSGESIRDTAKIFSDAGVKPTPGMLAPGSLASIEQNVARQKPEGKIAKSVDEAYNQIKEGLINVSPNPKEPAAIFEQISPLQRQIPDARRDLDKLDEAATKANLAADAAAEKLTVARAANDEKAIKQSFEELQASSELAFQNNLRSALDNAKELAVESVVSGRSGLDPATARNLGVEHVWKPIRAAFEEQGNRLYEGVDNLAAVFDPSPILAKAEEAGKLISGTKELPPKLASAIETVRANFGEGKVSLQALRNVRNDLNRRIRSQSYETDAEERLIKGVAAEITNQIQDQATTALGSEQGKQLLAANKFWRDKSTLFEQPGIDILFKDDPNDDTVRRVVAGMYKSGVNSDEYSNLKNIVVKIGEFDPGLSAALKGQSNAIIRGAILQDASTISASTGEKVIDGLELSKVMEKLESASPGTLKALGMGSGKNVAELKTLFEKYDAVKMSEADWEKLFRSPAFQQASAGKLATEFKSTFAHAQAENLLLRSAQLNAAGRAKAADERYKEALRVLNEVDGDLLQAREIYENLVNDPVAMAFSKPKLGQGDFNSFASSLFDPKAGKIANADVSEIANALRSGDQSHKDLLLRLQERYIADRIATYRNAPVSSESLKRSDVRGIAEFFNPNNKTDAANEIARAEALLEPAQLESLKDFAKVAEQVVKYEKLGGALEYAVSRDLPAPTLIRRAVDGAVNMFKRGKYEVAAKMISNPTAYSREIMSLGSATSKAAGQGGKVGALEAAKSVREDETVTPGP